MFFRRGLVAVLLVTGLGKAVWSTSGTEGASFLDIPVGGAPAALGSAYTAQANDAYAPVWNPAGLGFLHSVEFTGMHLDYLSPVYYEHAGLVVPVGKPEEGEAHSAGFGASIQYLGTNSIDARDVSGQPNGTFTAAFAAYSLAYGQKISDTLALGATAKVITEAISGASAKAYASDLGLLYKPTSKLSVGGVLANMGSEVKFVNESDPLPLAGRLGLTYQILPQWDWSVESVYRKSGLFSGSMGIEWRYGEIFSFRGGYNTVHTQQLGAGAGVTAGLGIFFWGQEFSYAWVPLGDLGQTHYFSLVFRWSTQARPERPRLKPVEESGTEELNDPSQYHDVYEFLNEKDSDAH